MCDCAPAGLLVAIHITPTAFKTSISMGQPVTISKQEGYAVITMAKEPVNR
jgi:hypothetical protein